MERRKILEIFRGNIRPLLESYMHSGCCSQQREYKETSQGKSIFILLKGVESEKVTAVLRRDGQ